MLTSMIVPQLVAFPRDDLAFVEYVRRCAGRSPVPTAELLQARIGAWYPHVSVVKRSELSGFGEPLWYVYRDGRILAVHGDRWWEQPGTARLAFGRDGHFLSASPKVAAILGIDADALVGRHWMSLVGARAACEDIDWLWETVLRAGSATSVAQIVRGDGTPTWIEYHLEATAQPDRFVGFVREFESVE